MKSDSLKTVEPKLRFPKFRKNSAWVIKKIDDLFSERQDTGFANLPLLSLTDKEGIIPQEDSNRKNNSNLDKSKYLRVVPGDIAYNTMRMWEGRSAFVGIEGLVSPAYTVCRPKSGTYSYFFAYYFKTLKLIEQFRRYSQGLVKDTLNLKYEAFSQIEIAIPKFPAEQQNIAGCLSSIDDLITAQTQKLNIFKTQKKGLMQQLFPCEGKAVPNFRFSIIRGKLEWVRKPLSKMYAFKGNNSLSRENLNYECGSVKNIHYGDIHTKLPTLFDITKEIVPYINPSQSLKVFKTENFCVEGDIIFADASEDLEDIGKSIEIFKLNGERLLSGLHTILARRTNNCLIIGFGGYLFKSQDVRTQIRKEAQWSKVFSISAGRLIKINISFPPEKSEQKKIVACLSTLDDLIIAQTQKLDALKTHKKGLMQQLFPFLKEVDL